MYVSFDGGHAANGATDSIVMLLESREEDKLGASDFSIVQPRTEGHALVSILTMLWDYEMNSTE